MKTIDTTTARTSTKRSNWRRAVASGLVLASVCGAAVLPASSLASSKVINTYNVSVKKGVLDDGNVVKAKAVITNGAAQQSSWWSQGTINQVVRTGVNKGYGKPYVSQGYRCVPVVQAWNANFTCKLTGADVATQIKLTFKASWHH